MPEQDYPGLRINSIIKERMVSYLYDEIDKARRARANAIAIWDDIKRLYNQLNVPEKKDKPFEGAADIMIPIIATYVEQIHARIMDTIYGTADPYVSKPTREEFFKVLEGIEEDANVGC